MGKADGVMDYGTRRADVTTSPTLGRYSGSNDGAKGYWHRAMRSSTGLEVTPIGVGFPEGASHTRLTSRTCTESWGAIKANHPLSVLRPACPNAARQSRMWPAQSLLEVAPGC